jgi:cobaltochelatase CobS
LDTTMNDTTAIAFDLIAARAAAAEFDLADLPKDMLIELSRRVFGVVGDSARTAKGAYLAKLQGADRDKVVDSIVAMIEAGDLAFDPNGIDDGEAEPAPAPAPRQQRQRAATPVDDSDGAAKLRAAFEALGIGQAQATPVDADEVRAICGSVVAEALASFQMPERVVTLSAAGERREIKGHVHTAFDRVVKLAGIRQNVLLVGPAGCGKTQLAAQVAEALGLPFAFVSCSAGMSESALQGWLLPIEAGGAFAYVPSAFVTAYRDGGVFLLDEIDAADENLLLVINAALANGHMMIPQNHTAPLVKRHADFVCIAAANTFGHGADRVYAGRNQLDGATLDRFRAGMTPMTYCPKLEAAIVDAQVLAWGSAIRSQIESNKLRRVMSTRAMLDFSRQKDLLGFTVDDFSAAYFADWTRDELAKVGR